MANLICASSWGYGWDDVRVWANSLTRAKIDCHKIVFLRDTNPEVAEKLQNLGISSQVWTVRNKHLHPITTRWEPIIDHLSSNAYDLIVVADVKDCAFQADPFPFIASSPKPIVLATDEGDSIRNAGDNWKWMQAYLGNGAQWTADKETVCGGTITGRSSVLLELLKEMYHILLTHKDHRLIDQAVLNHLAHTKYKDRVYIPPHSKGFILSSPRSYKDADIRDAVAYPKGSPNPFKLWHLYLNRYWDPVRQLYW